MRNTSKISSLKTLRLKNETIEYFKGKPLNKYVDDLVRHCEYGDIKLRGEEIEVIGLRLPPEVVKDLEILGALNDMTFGDLFMELYRALDEGEIDIKDKEFVYKGKKERRY